MNVNGSPRPFKVVKKKGKKKIDKKKRTPTPKKTNNTPTINDILEMINRVGA